MSMDSLSLKTLNPFSSTQKLAEIASKNVKIFRDLRNTKISDFVKDTQSTIVKEITTTSLNEGKLCCSIDIGDNKFDFSKDEWEEIILQIGEYLDKENLQHSNIDCEFAIRWPDPEMLLELTEIDTN